MKINLMICFFIAFLCNVTFAASPGSLTHPPVHVLIKSQFVGTTINGVVPQPADYGPDVQIMPINTWDTVDMGMFPVDPTRDIFFWDNVKIPKIESKTANCGAMAKGAKEIVIVVDGHYPIPHFIRCHVESIF